MDIYEEALANEERDRAINELKALSSTAFVHEGRINVEELIKALAQIQVGATLASEGEKVVCRFKHDWSV
jgi:hypothetical protein